jgi:hypothetical protein
MHETSKNSLIVVALLSHGIQITFCVVCTGNANPAFHPKIPSLYFFHVWPHENFLQFILVCSRITNFKAGTCGREKIDEF